MKKILLVGLLVLSVFLISCGEETLPPEPAPPGAIPTEGSGAIAGQAVAYAGYADPEGFFNVDPLSFRWAHRAVSDFLGFFVTNDQLVYKTGYITDRGQSWTSFDYEGEQVGSSNWLRGNANGVHEVSLANSIEGNDNYVVAYACTRRLGAWDCHGNQWMLRQYSVEVRCENDLECPEGQFCDAGECIGLPSAPVAPPGQLNGCAEGYVVEPADVLATCGNRGHVQYFACRKGSVVMAPEETTLGWPCLGTNVELVFRTDPNIDPERFCCGQRT